VTVAIKKVKPYPSGKTSKYLQESSSAIQIVEGRSLGDQQPSRELRSPREEIFRTYVSSLSLRDLDDYIKMYHIPKSCRIVMPSKKDHVTYPSRGFVAISPQHLLAGLRFLIPPFIINFLNQLKLAPFQLSPNSYNHLVSLGLLYTRHGLSPTTVEVLSYLFTLKAVGPKDGIYYLSARPSETPFLSKIKVKSNAGPYKTSYFYISCISLRHLDNFGFVYTLGN